MKKLVLLASIFAACAGCSTVPSDPGQEVANAVHPYYQANRVANRTYTPIAVEGVQSLTLSGTNVSLRVEAIAEPVRALPTDNKSFMSELGEFGKFALAAWFGIEALDAAGETTVVPAAEPIVLQPEVITVP